MALPTRAKHTCMLYASVLYFGPVIHVLGTQTIGEKNACNHQKTQAKRHKIFYSSFLFGPLKCPSIATWGNPL